MPADTAKVYGVRRLLGALRESLEGGYADIWVRGEISSLAAPASGHLYFSLKEGNSLIRCALFGRGRRPNLHCRPANGMLALVRARVSIYEARGDMQLIVTYLEDAGEGALRREFELLKRTLAAQGLFDSRHKRAVPPAPARIGVVTSDSGAALHDIRVTLRRRYPLARLVIYPSAVQGDEAIAGITTMLALANRRREVEVLIVARGGGSFEDLQAFNSEAVARAIFASDLPVISAIGHEIDFTIADLAADARAPTPTAAAEMVTPDAARLRAEIARGRDELRAHAQRCINALRQRLDYAAAGLIRPARRLEAAWQARRALLGALGHLMNARLDARRLRLQQRAAALQQCSPRLALLDARRRFTNAHNGLRAAAARFEMRAQQVAHLTQKLQLLGPAQTLERGYAVLQARHGAVVSDAAATHRGQVLTARVARGRFECVVGRVISKR